MPCAIFDGRASWGSTCPREALTCLPLEPSRGVAVLATTHAPRTRRSFARLNKVLDVPHLIDLQRKAFGWLTDPKHGGLGETIDDISPIEDYTGNLAVQFGEFTFDEPIASLEQCREKDLTYARPLTVTVAFINRETGEIREQSVFMGDFPWMTDRGTFIINGTERVVVTQLVRSPGEPPSIDAAKALLNQLFVDPKRYDLTRVGRYKLNSRLNLDIDLDTRTLTHDDIIALVKELVSLPPLLGMSEDPGEEIKDFAAEAITLPREPIEDHLDEYEHFGNRRLRTVGELIQEAFQIGRFRMERVGSERLATADGDTVKLQNNAN